MLYASLLGEVLGEYKRKKSFPIVFDTKGCNAEDVSIRVRSDNKIWVSGSDEGEEVFTLLKGDDFVPTPLNGEVNLCNKELADTAENPILVVCTKGLKFYKDTPCLLKVLYIDTDMMLVALIYGSCEFEFADGSFVPLQRCDDSNLNTKKVVSTLNTKGMQELTVNHTRGGWDKSLEMVNPIFVSCGEVNSHYRYVRGYENIFNQKGIDAQEAAEEKARIEKLKMEEISKEEARIHLEEARARHIEENRRLAEEKSKKEAAARMAKKSKKAEEKPVSCSVGAMDFLAAVARA